MAKYSTFNELLVNNSITNDLNDEKLDKENPFSFIKFLGYSKILDNSLQNIDLYKKYLNEWDDITVNTEVNENDLIKKQFIDLFRTIILEYTTEEEKRYFNNINLNSEEDLSIVIPFFSKKIKEICQYYQNKRNFYKRDLNLINKKGSINGVKSFIKNNLIDLIYGDNQEINVTRSLTLSSFVQNVEIEIEEGYDIYNDIYDKSNSQPVIFYDSPTINTNLEIIETESEQAEVEVTTPPPPTTTPEPPVTTPEPIVIPFSENFWNTNNVNSNLVNFIVINNNDDDQFINWGDNTRLTSYTREVTASHDFLIA